MFCEWVYFWDTIQFRYSILSICRRDVSISFRHTRAGFAEIPQTREKIVNHQRLLTILRQPIRITDGK